MMFDDRNRSENYGFAMIEVPTQCRAENGLRQVNPRKYSTMSRKTQLKRVYA